MGGDIGGCHGDKHVILTVGEVPGQPSELAVIEATKSYVVLAWKPPFQRGHEGVMYYVEKVSRMGLIHTEEEGTCVSHDYLL